MFLTIVTRTSNRPVLLARQQETLDLQTCQDFEQIILPDQLRLGVPQANYRLANLDAQFLPRADYILILDDDDMFVAPEAIELLKQRPRADVIIFKGEVGSKGILPSKGWGKHPHLYDIGSFNFIVRFNTWMRHNHFFGRPQCGDFYFINAVLKSGASVLWYDQLLVAAQRVSNGAPECELA